MKKHSCGAILYTIQNNIVYIVLGMEKGEWFPFKGIREKGETNIQAALREIKEETCNAINVNHIDLKCNYSTKRKHYHIGLTRITKDEFNQFYLNRYNMLNNYNQDGNKLKYNWPYLEKEDIKMFPIEDIMKFNFHEITEIPIRYYYNQLIRLQRDIQNGSIISKTSQLHEKIHNPLFIKKNPQCRSSKVHKLECSPIVSV